MARANLQWVSLKNADEVPVIFQELNAYISADLFETRVSVPTWNYIAVHVYGKSVNTVSNKKIKYLQIYQTISINQKILLFCI